MTSSGHIFYYELAIVWPVKIGRVQSIICQIEN